MDDKKGRRLRNSGGATCATGIIMSSNTALNAATLTVSVPSVATVATTLGVVMATGGSVCLVAGLGYGAYKFLNKK